MYDNLFPVGLLWGGASAMVFLFFAVIYVYTSVTLMTIANRAKVANSWLAWIPIANIYLMTQVAGLPWWWTFAVLLPVIPLIGSLALLGIVAWWWWKIAERLKFPGWLGLLTIIPGINLVVMGILAWARK